MRDDRPEAGWPGPGRRRPVRGRSARWSQCWRRRPWSTPADCGVAASWWGADRRCRMPAGCCRSRIASRQRRRDRPTVAAGEPTPSVTGDRRSRASWPSPVRFVGRSRRAVTLRFVPAGVRAADRLRPRPPGLLAPLRHGRPGGRARWRARSGSARRSSRRSARAGPGCPTCRRRRTSWRPTTRCWSARGTCGSGSPRPR